MKFPISISAFSPALISALLTVGSLYAMGRLSLGALRLDRFGDHVPVGVGFGLNHLLFLLSSLFMDGPDAVTLMNVMHVSVIALFLYKSRGKPIKPKPVDSLWLVFVTIAFLPFVFRALAPP